MSPVDTAGAVDERRAVAAFLRALAARAEGDATLAASLSAALRESGLLADTAPVSAPLSAPAKAAGRRGAGRAGQPTSEAAPDPFAIYRAGGEPGLRAALEGADLPTLRAIIRSRLLDPARISARWTARDRLVALIVDQVKARANHGRAFERV